MNLLEQAEVESLKKEFVYLTDLLKKHQTREACYQRPQYHSSISSHPNQSWYSKIKTVRPEKFNNLNVYQSKCHASISSSGSTSNGVTGRTLTTRNHTQKLIPFSVLPKQNTSYSATQSMPYKYNKTSSYTRKLPPSSFKTVRTSNSVKDISNTMKVTNSDSAVDTKFDNFLKPVSISDSSRSSLSSTKNCSLPSKDAKVSYLSCSDCVIEISEYANGELHITTKKSEPCIESKPNNQTVSGAASGSSISDSSLDDLDYEKSATASLNEKLVDSSSSSEQCSVFPKPVTGLESRTVSHDAHCLPKHPDYTDGAIESSSVGNVIKSSTTNLMSQRELISSSSKLNKSQPSCARNAKYSKINASTLKSSQNLAARHLLKNKYSLKKFNVVKYNSKSKYKVNRDGKKCVPHPVKYTYVAKLSSPTFQKHPVSSVSEKNVLPSVNHVGRRIFSASCSQLNTYSHCHAKKLFPLQHKTHITKSNLATSSYTRISRKTKSLHLKNIYKVVNKSNLGASRIVAKNSPLCKPLCMKSISNPLPKCGDQSCAKKWSTDGTSDSSSNIAQHNLNASPHENFSDNHVSKTESEKMLRRSRTQYTTSSYKFKNVLNGSKIITRHSLQRIPQKKNFTKKQSFSPMHKSSLDSRTPVKKIKKVLLSKTPYKVVNKHASHVSQVVQMIKTKYRTVNKRSASNSHLKWLHEQRKTYLKMKFQKSLIHANGRWTYSHSSSGHFRKHPILCSKTSRKQSSLQKKVLKEIRGVTYRVSKTKINKSIKPKALKKNGFISLQQRSKIPLSQIKTGGFTCTQHKASHSLVTFSSRTQNLASRMLHRSIHTVRAAEAKKTMQKNNMFCMFFNRFGRCNKEGNCHYIHDPSKIAVCTRFLRGTCKIDGCPFSHEVSPGKMAICSFFLQGNCTNSSCPYQHTSIKPGTRLCKAFVKGYCDSGNQCPDAHILACPQFICEGFCAKGSSCTWPHPPVKKSIKKGSDHSEVKEIQEENAAVDEVGDLRYFTYESGFVSDQCIKQLESLEDSTQVRKRVSNISKKVKFYRQPEFIPLHVSDEEF